MSDAPGYVWALALIGVIGIPVATCVVLYRGALRAGLPGPVAARVAGGAGALFAVLLTLAAALGGAGLLQQRDEGLRQGLPLLFLGVLVVLLAATRIPVVARTLRAPGTGAELMLPHTLRVVGAVFVITMALGHLPAVFALPAGLGDILVGLAAPLAYRRHRRGVRHAALWFNLAGLADLVLALTLGFLAAAGPARLLDVTPSTMAASVLPLALIPTVVVPLAIALHLTSLRRLTSRAIDSDAERGILRP